MKSVKDVRRLYQEAALRTNPARDRAVLAEALRAGGLAHSQPPARAKPRIWRTIMKSRTTKLVTAAGIVAAILISVSHFNGTVVKAVEFEEITQAMQHVPWMHMVATGFEPRTGGRAEQWIGFESKIQATWLANGTALFISGKDHQQFEYDPNSRTITVRYLESLPVDIVSPAGVLTTMRKVLEQRGVQIVVKMGVDQGRKVQIQEITSSNVGRQEGTELLTLYIDPDAKLLYRAEGKALDAAGKVIMAGTMTFDYPSSGPQSIYDLGVPRDARTGDKGPQTSLQTLLDQYQRVRVEATREYIAVLVHYDRQPGDVPGTVDVDYKSRRKWREERHSVFHLGEAPALLWPHYRQQLGDSFESLLAWTRRHYDDPRARLSINLYDGQYDASVYGESGWSKVSKRYSPGNDLDPTVSLAHQAWPPIDPAGRIIEDDYARQNGWVCVETVSQGLVTPNGWASLPGRFFYYLDPSRDYLCRREVDERCRDASWQKDKNWLAGVDPTKVPQDSTTVIDISEVTQASNGHWYPQTIIESRNAFTRGKKPFQETMTKKVYLQVSPKFPDGIFDIDKLPGQ